VEIPLEYPLDSLGFLRRECPKCEGEFKWHHGPTPDAPEGFVYPPLYWCPRCGESAPPDAWWTQAQLDYQQEVLAASMDDILGDDFKSSGNDFLKFEVNRSSNEAYPDPLVEPDDMQIITSPCHPWEPVKVPVDVSGPFHCLLCGQAYAV
jgi:hypothetical protein